ncbi:MAG: hypothetical protein DWQ47_07805 [Acidobacteria bacterium]|nr:MAG: hypothetical protein DWQ32_15905 [Acidobacteriota bacterium]REJ99177.1 MAG: hypothetical protein DWQ38_14070 [Acidobacteriota bacterium]REK16102.1 MAG: hypothetical protein DWQ43_03615 [Acidobacteriota bacterium]REK43783.1 MAG: hypothetical protein DWQ47_07805 [Acidobacteriota bacterium]
MLLDTKRRVDMLNPRRFVVGLVCLLFLASSFNSQDSIEFTVTSVSDVSPFPITHMSKKADTKVSFRISNNSSGDFVLFGSLSEGKLMPVRYILSFNTIKDKWEYPTRDKKPVPWIDVSATYKNELVLKPDDHIDFESYFSSVSDCGVVFRATVQIRERKSPETKEIRSSPFEVGKCDTSTR